MDIENNILFLRGNVNRMKRSRLYGICLVKNEDDIISQSLTYATQYCDKIFVLDNGSTDETWQIVQSLAKQYPQIIPFAQSYDPYGDGLRSLVYNEFHHKLSDDDWWLILDADEFLGEDPQPLIQRAMQENADIIFAWQIQFYYTEVDYQTWLEGRDSRDLPIFARRRFYLINWQEPRLFRNQMEPSWDERILKLPKGLKKVCKQRIYNRHFQFRDPDQIQKRLNLRFGNPYFPHVISKDWHNEIRSSRKLDYYKDGEAWQLRTSGIIYFYRKHLTYKIRWKIKKALKILGHIFFL